MQYCKSDKTAKSCQCADCTLEACVEYSHGLVKQSMHTLSPSKGTTFEDSDGNDSFSFGDQRQEEEEEGDSSYLYRLPLLTHPNSEGHSMGIVLPKIITFNLALAHQLKAVEDNDENRYKTVVKLYQFVYTTEMKGRNKASLFIALVAANNLADIHRRLNNRSKHQQCLQFVLSVIMLIRYDVASKRDSLNVELEGFLRNVSHLILKATCAPVA